MADYGNDISTDTSDSDNYTSCEVSIEGSSDNIISDTSWTNIILAESILTPGLQTSIKFQSYTDLLPIKNFDDVKGLPISIYIKKPSLADAPYYLPFDKTIVQTLYRLGGRSSTDANATNNRKLINRTVEELTLHACDETLLNDAASLVSKMWKCTTPSAITDEVLRSCAGAKNLNIEQCDPARDFVAENKHPFGVVAQQANAALAGGNDPSFLHFMTYEKAESGQGTHHFRSLKTMTQQAPIMKLKYDQTGSSYTKPDSIMNYYFPCDFDLLSDILNGVGSNGADMNSLALFNPSKGIFSLLGNQATGCGIGGGAYKIAQSNQGSEKAEYSCPDFVSTYLLKRQARMALLEKDKIALRLTVAWNPIYHVGKMINIELLNNTSGKESYLRYGSGDYLIVALVHNIKAGGYSTITIDCVSKTVGEGQV